MKVNPSDYDYVMYVDASGDDGFRFDKDSSVCYAAAALLVKQEEIPHNLSILSQIKKTVGCKDTDEVKYSTIRRHPHGADALSLLKDIKGKMSCHVVFKKEILPEDRPAAGSKELSVICHLMALCSLGHYNFSDGEKVLVTIDRMKRTEETPIAGFMSSDYFHDRMHAPPSCSIETIFRDSKDCNFLLLQIADLLCGIVREHFEQYETNPDMLHFRSHCPSCFNLQFVRGAKSIRSLCKNGKSRFQKIIQSKNLHNIFHLIPKQRSPHVMDYFFMQPTNMINQHFYLICTKI